MWQSTTRTRNVAINSPLGIYSKALFASVAVWCVLSLSPQPTVGRHAASGVLAADPPGEDARIQIGAAEWRPLVVLSYPTSSSFPRVEVSASFFLMGAGVQDYIMLLRM